MKQVNLHSTLVRTLIPTIACILSFGIAADGLPRGIQRIEILDPPAHFFSGAISKTGSDSATIQLLSVPDGTMVEYTLSAQKAEARPSRKLDKNLLGFTDTKELKTGATQITRHGSTFTLGDPTGRFSQIMIGDSVRVLGESRTLSRNPNLTREQVMALWAWTTDGATILGFGDILRKADDSQESTQSDQWSSAFLELAFDSTDQHRILREISLTNPARNYYLYLPNLFTTAGYNHYYIDMERPPAIHRYSPWGDRELFAVFEGSLKSPKILPGGAGAESEKEAHEELHSSSYPAGIFPFPTEERGDLILLTHHVDENSVRTWQATHINTLTRETIDYRLPSQADHILLLTSEDFIVAIEQTDQFSESPAQLGLNQTAKTALLIPTARLDELEEKQSQWSLYFQ